MISLVEKEFFKTAKAEIDKCLESNGEKLPDVRVMSVGKRGYSIYLTSNDLRFVLASSRKEARRFAKIETARALIKSYGISIFTVADLSIT